MLKDLEQSFEDSKHELARYFDNHTGQFQIPFEHCAFASVSKPMIAILRSRKYVLLCVDVGDERPDYLLAPLKVSGYQIEGYTLEPLNKCRDFVLNIYRTHHCEASFKTSFKIKEYFSNERLSQVIDRVLEQGIYLYNWVDGYGPVLGIDENDSSKFCWYEIKDFY